MKSKYILIEISLRSKTKGLFSDFSTALEMTLNPNKINYLVNNNSLYFVSGQIVSSTIVSSLSQ